MRYGHFLRAIALFSTILIGQPLLAQLTEEQKVHDFQNLAGLYAKTYAPSEWKKQLFGYDVLNIDPWLDLVRRSKSDLEYIEVCLRYVARLNDSHSAFFFNSSFAADAGFYVDLYGDQVLVEAIDRSIVPVSIPIRAGDELLAIDGKPVAQLVDEFLPLIGDANERMRKRMAVDLLTFRYQQAWPRAIDLPDASVFQIRHQTGTVASYTITWDKFGFPIRQVGPVTTPGSKALARTAAQDEAESGFELWNFSTNLTPAQLRRNTAQAKIARALDAGDEPAVEGMLIGFGSITPRFAIPGNFTIRRGRGIADNFFTASYEVAGKKIGYLRIPSFAPANLSAALTELITEVSFFNANTDGLVIDVTKNPGGDACYLRSVLSMLIPVRFTYEKLEIRPTIRNVNSATAALESAQLSGADADTIAGYKNTLEAIKTAYAANHGMTPPVPLCAATAEVEPLKFSNGDVFAYSKPLIVLTDDFSASGADVFPAVMQDANRGPIVGMYTTGAGGTVVGSIMTGIYSESAAYTTSSLIVRSKPVNYPGTPATSYIENIGVRPDIFLDYMVPENLLLAGRPFVNNFTGAILAEILKTGK